MRPDYEPPEFLSPSQGGGSDNADAHWRGALILFWLVVVMGFVNLASCYTQT